ncbi:MAG: LacI family DNA-binding transcriptional regulator [Solirubrobacteraceae bacterium]|jgi:LacI family transcriptional regulator
MRDVAALAGVSLKTVSRVINGEPTVASDLTERVRRAAATLDYRPDLAARNLRSIDRRTRTIGVLLENVANPYSSAVHRAVEDLARGRGVAVFAGSIDESPSRERELALEMVARRVDGLIIVPSGDDQSYLAGDQRSGLSLVFVDRPPQLLRADAVLSDNDGGSRAAVAHLLAGGHRRIAFLGDLAGIPTVQARLAGYTAALDRAGIAVEPELVRLDLHGADVAEAVVGALMRGPAPTAIFATQNLITIGTLRSLRALGLQRRIALVGFDDFLLADLLEPAVTVVAQDPTAIGRTACEILFARMEGSTGPAGIRTIPTRLIPRGSGEIPPSP